MRVIESVRAIFPLPLASLSFPAIFANDVESFLRVRDVGAFGVAGVGKNFSAYANRADVASE